jgi:hypothetical protein
MRRSDLLVLPLVLLATLSLTNPARAQGVPVFSNGGLTATLQPEESMPPGLSNLLRPASVDLSSARRWLLSFATPGARTSFRGALKSQRQTAKRNPARVP